MQRWLLAASMNSSASANGISVRQIEPRDASAVSSLAEQLGYSRTAQQILDWIQTAHPAQQAAFVACFNGEVVGWVEVAMENHLQSAPLALIGGLVVKETMRGRGIGRELCRRAELWGWEHGAERIRVTSRSTRLDAHRFYARDGYQVVKTSLVFEKGRAV
jgi:predicted N-acetyltransferase YhbS